MSNLASLSAEHIQKGLRSRWKTLQPNLRAAATWRGHNPRIYLHNAHPHPVFATYNSHPALNYAPYPVARLCHWVDMLPQKRDASKGHIYEVEHLIALARPGRTFMQDWFSIFDDHDFIESIVQDKTCHRVITFSQGLVEHFQSFTPRAWWPKFDFVYPAFPDQEHHERASGPFTILVIASRWSDKGLPEALRTFEILRKRHGRGVRLILVSQAVPENTVLPDGVTVHNVPRLSEEHKARLYREADVLLLPCLSETAACFTEAYAFGVPVVTTRIHHGEEFVQNQRTGFLLHAPLFPYSQGFGTTWRTWNDFLGDLEKRRGKGELEGIVEQAVGHLEAMICGDVDLTQMRANARRFHQQNFSPQARNSKLLSIYDRALGEMESLGRAS